MFFEPGVQKCYNPLRHLANEMGIPKKRFTPHFENKTKLVQEVVL